MIRIFLIRIAIVAAASLSIWQLSHGSAFSCNRYDGCGRETMRESYDMMHDGRNTAAMAAARANMDAFRAMQSQISGQHVSSTGKAGK